VGDIGPFATERSSTVLESVATMIELSHRLTSSLTGFLIIILLVWAFRVFPKASLVRRSAILSFVFVVVEGAFGALLVLAELVEDNASVWRAIAIGLHLINTLILLYWLTLVAWECV
jgi:heme A synthase